MIRFLPILFLVQATMVLADASLDIVLDRGASPVAANAYMRELKTTIKGTIEKDTVRFEKLPPGAKLDLDISLSDGTTVTGVDMGWYNSEKPDEQAGELSDDDQKQIRDICDVPSFYNKVRILLTEGKHDRATLLVEQIRDTDFHSDKGGEIVWRLELWYFKFQHGGWEKVQQQNRILGRERFKSQAEYDASTKKIRWAPWLGGIVLQKDQARTIVDPPRPTTVPAKPQPRERILDP